MLMYLKLSSNSFMLMALLPVPKFLHKIKWMCSVLEDRLVHECLDIVLEPLKKATQYGTMLPDPDGNMQYCFTPLISYIANTPEATMITCVGGKMSPVTMAIYKHFGDPFCHEPQTASMTLTQLHIVQSKAHSSNLQAFFYEAQCFRLNGISKPFFRNLPLSCPSSFLMPEMLHYLHKECWDHNVKWCLNVIGDSELDFQLFIMQPIAGYCHFKSGISKLKQVTG